MVRKNNFWWIKVLICLVGAGLSLMAMALTTNILIGIAVTGLWLVPVASWTIVDIILGDAKLPHKKKHKTKKVNRMEYPTNIFKKIVLGICGIVPFLAWGLHIYLAVIAFTEFKLWFALVVTFVPVLGDIAFIGACIGEGIIEPIIVCGVYIVLYLIAHVISSFLCKSLDE